MTEPQQRAALPGADATAAADATATNHPADLAGQTAVVVGGTSGIGRAISLMLAARGARVGLIGRDAERGAAVVRAIAAAGGTARWVRADFMKYPELAAAATTLAADLGPCDILIASGGPGGIRPQPFLDTPPEEYDFFFASRCIGRLYTVRAFCDQMIATGRGKIVLLTTDGGRMPTPSEVLNGSAAAGLIFATRALARELSGKGLRINTVSTTLTADTPSYERFQAKMAGAPDGLARAFRKIEGRTPLGGLNTPEDVANAVLFFAGPESDRITGAVLSVNGGLSLP